MILEIQSLTAGYNAGPDILHDVNLSVHENEIVTIIGPNGAGKSTILKSIFGLTDIRNGKIIHGSRDITYHKTDQIIRSGIAMVSQGQNIFPDLTVEENLEMGAFIRQDKKELNQKKEEVFSFFPILKKFREKKAGILSGGERQMVALGMSLMLSPEILLLDEPSIGLAPKVMQEVFEKILQIRESGTTILMVEQNAAKALTISDRGYVLELGKNALEGKGKDLLRNPRVGELYLGKSQKALTHKKKSVTKKKS
ncbi:ABC transporter ATP-binding protein [Candidatus Gracilibacteria bacterium]|nr:ABC transporter ATP-binding protein [Candidatus Gracilibacteria bacterium]MCF7819768.1 ABC transporter ATP-binding protein [Candidatus Gracilibacteria bacterium]